MHQRHAQQTTNARRIIHASEVFARQIATTIKVVCPMNDVYVERVDQFVTPMLPAELAKFAKIDCVKWDAVMI